MKDGSRFVLPALVNVTNITAGELVTVSWQKIGNVKAVTSVSRAISILHRHLSASRTNLGGFGLSLLYLRRYLIAMR